MDYIKISLNLLYYYNDHRQLTRLFISDDMLTIGDLEYHISNMFNIENNFYLMCQNHYLPSSEDIRILNDGDVIYVTPAQVSNVEVLTKKTSKKSKCKEEEVIAEVEPVDVSIKTKKRRKCLSPSNSTLEGDIIDETNNKKEKKKKKKSIVEEVIPDMVAASKKEKRKQQELESMETSDVLELNSSMNNGCVMHPTPSQWDSKKVRSTHSKSGNFIIHPKKNSQENLTNQQYTNTAPIIHSVKVIKNILNKKVEKNLSVTEKINLFESKSPTNNTLNSSIKNSSQNVTTKHQNGNSPEPSNLSIKTSSVSVSSILQSKNSSETTISLKNSPRSVSSNNQDDDCPETTNSSNQNSPRNKTSNAVDCISVGEKLLKQIVSTNLSTNDTELLNTSDCFNKSNDFDNTENEYVTKRRRRVRTRKRKRPSDVTNTEIVEHVTFRPPKTRAAPALHIKFNQEQNDVSNEINSSTEINLDTNQSNNQNNSLNKVNTSSESNTDNKTSKLTLFHSTPYIKEDTSLNSRQSFDESETNITGNTSNNSSMTKRDFYTNKPDPTSFPLLTGNVTKSNLIFFKKLKIGPNYTPEISNYIFAQVEDVSSDGNQLIVKVLDGRTEFDDPVGKFSCIPEDNNEDESFKTNKDSICIDRASMIEPRVMKIATVYLTKGSCE